jgi:RHS repeat-associated protein
MYRLSGMTSGSTTVVNGVSYNAANQLLGMTFNGIGETRSYNVLNQLTKVHAGSGLNLTYNYPTGADNGKISSMYNAVSGETVTYTYDSLNRLATAGGSGWGDAYTFDGFGNLNAKTVTAGSGPSMSVVVNEATNRIGSTDANGNTFMANAAYDVENHTYALVGASPYTSYSYDAQNKRVFTYTSGAVDSYGNPINYLVVLYSASGQKLGTYQFYTCNTSSLCSLLMTSDQYFGGRRLASMDQLGSVGTYYPWGEAKGTTNPQDAWSYATYWRDSATGLDYANNRYYSNAYGRFMTPDPSAKSEDPRSPQSWNRYPYVQGDPVNSNDPTGLDSFDGGDGGVCDYDPFLAECDGPFDPYGGTALPPAPASSYPPPPTSVTVPINGGPGDIGSLTIGLTNDSFTFQFASAGNAAVLLGICAADPVCVVVGGAVVTAAVIIYIAGPAIAQAFQNAQTTDAIRAQCEQWANNAVANWKPGMPSDLKNWAKAYGECIRYGGPAGANKVYGVNF